MGQSFDLGQRELRETWEQTPDPRWAETHFLPNNKVDPRLCFDVPLARVKFLENLRSKFYLPQHWIPSLLQYVSAVRKHPIDAVPEIFLLVNFWLGILSFVALIFGAFWIMVWGQPIARDFPRVFSSTLAVNLFALGSIVVGILLNQVLVFSVILFSLVFLYSRRAGGPLIVLIALSFGIILRPLEPLVVQSAQMASAVEALEAGRTRLEYSEISLSALTPLERGIWSEGNGRRDLSRTWLQQTEESLEKKIFEGVLYASESGPHQGLKFFEGLLPPENADPVLLFNLAQLAAQTQNLVAADRYRSLLGSDQLAELSRDFEGSNHQLLWKLPRKASDLFLTELQSQLASGPFQSWKFAATLIVLIGLLIFLSIRRRSSSGVCDHTGLPTPMVTSRESVTYQSIRQKSQLNTTLGRQQIDQSMRAHLSLSERRIQWWGFLLPSARGLVSDKQGTATFVVLLCIWTLLVGSMSGDFYSLFLKHIGVFAQPRLTDTGIAIPLLAMAIGLWVLSVILNSRKVRA